MTRKRFFLSHSEEALHRDQRGQAMVEFALTFLLVLTVLIGMIEFSSAIYTKTVLSDAVNEGMRYLIVNNTDQAGTTAVIQNYARLSLHNTSAMTITYSPSTGPYPPPTLVTITVSYPYLPYIAHFMKNPPTLTAFAEGRTVH